MRPCYTCGAPNPDDKTACYSCGQSLVSPSPAPGQVPPAANPYPQQHAPQQPYPPQPYAPQQHAPQQYQPQQPAQQYPPQAYAPQAPMPPMPQGYAPQQPYPPQPGAAPYAQAQYPAQPHIQPNYPPQAYGQPPYPPGYAQPFAPGMAPQQMAAAPPGFNPAEQVRAAQIKTEYRAITRRLLLTVLVTIVAGTAIAYGLKGHQAVLGIPTMFWCCAPVLGMMAYAVAICRCPGCKASLMMRNDVNETGQCPFCDAQLK